MSGLSALHSSVDFRLTHYEIAGDLGERRPAPYVAKELKRNDHILRFEYHEAIIHSLFANSEWLLVCPFFRPRASDVLWWRRNVQTLC